MRRSPEIPVSLPAEAITVSITGASEKSAQIPAGLEAQTPIGDFGAPLTRLRARGIKGEPVPQGPQPINPDRRGSAPVKDLIPGVATKLPVRRVLAR